MDQARTSTEARQGYRISLGFQKFNVATVTACAEPMLAGAASIEGFAWIYPMAANTSSATGPPDAGFCPVIRRPSAMAKGAQGASAF